MLLLFVAWVVNDNPERNLTGEMEDDIPGGKMVFIGFFGNDRSFLAGLFYKQKQ